NGLHRECPANAGGTTGKSGAPDIRRAGRMVDPSRMSVRMCGAQKPFRQGTSPGWHEAPGERCGGLHGPHRAMQMECVRKRLPPELVARGQETRRIEGLQKQKKR